MNDFVVFYGSREIARGTLAESGSKAKEVMDQGAEARILIFDAETSEQAEVDYRGTVVDVAKRLEARTALTASGHARNGLEGSRGPGRPKLGVVGKEVTLLPRHWDWLSEQPGGPSVTLRKLVEAARKGGGDADRARKAQEAAYRFMNVMAGNLPAFEEATRILFSKNRERFKEFERCVAAWPVDVRRHALRLASSACS